MYILIHQSLKNTTQLTSHDEDELMVGVRDDVDEDENKKIKQTLYYGLQNQSLIIKS